MVQWSTAGPLDEGKVWVDELTLKILCTQATKGYVKPHKEAEHLPKYQHL